MAYDIKFRERAIAYKESGATFKQLKEAFGIDSKRYYAWVKQLEETGSLKAKNPPGRPAKIDLEELRKAVEEKPDAYLREHAENFNCSDTAILKALRRMGYTYKKRHSPTRKNPRKSEKNT